VAARASGTLPRLPATSTHLCPGRHEPGRRGTVRADGLPCAPPGRNYSASSTGLRGRRGHTSTFPTAPVEERPYGPSSARAVELRAGAALDADLGSGAWRDGSADLRASRGRTRACGYWSPTTGVAHRAETQRSEPPPAHRRRCSAGQTDSSGAAPGVCPPGSGGRDPTRSVHTGAMSARSSPRLTASGPAPGFSHTNDDCDEARRRRRVDSRREGLPVRSGGVSRACVCPSGAANRTGTFGPRARYFGRRVRVVWPR
jgi:hypothetical protein